MPNLIFLTQQVVTNACGADTWEQICDQAGLEGTAAVLGKAPNEQPATTGP